MSIKVKHKKSKGQTKIVKHRVTVNVILQNILYQKCKQIGCK